MTYTIHTTTRHYPTIGEVEERNAQAPRMQWGTKVTIPVPAR